MEMRAGSSDGARSNVARSMKAPDVMEANILYGMGTKPRADDHGRTEGWVGPDWEGPVISVVESRNKITRRTCRWPEAPAVLQER